MLHASSVFDNPITLPMHIIAFGMAVMISLKPEYVVRRLSRRNGRTPEAWPKAFFAFRAIWLLIAVGSGFDLCMFFLKRHQK